jgi:uncharacterized protein YciI
MRTKGWWMRIAGLLAAASLAVPAWAAPPAPSAPAASAPATDGASSAWDEPLARALGADEFGMRPYVLVILLTGPKPMQPGPARDEMFKGHFANMKRLAADGKLAVAGPLDGQEGRRGIFVMAVSTIAEARTLTETDPVIANGEMVAQYHRFYGSAALMQVRETHERIAKKKM